MFLIEENDESGREGSDPDANVKEPKDAPEAGRAQARLDALMPELYEELRRLAALQMSRQGPGHTLQTTALAHEAYLKLASAGRLEVADRPRLLALAARAMRQVLVDYARARRRSKRGGNLPRVTLSESVAETPPPAFDILVLDEALSRLAAQDPDQARVVELRFLGGLTVDETAQALEVSSATVKRESAMALAWLYRELSDGR